ncbi:UNVERIFIED_ORG: ferredoxin [Nocardia globerula]|uniref:Ferredoxin n=2 Tax=Nocardiaceae TaxID=85025 RepID=A0A652YHY8_NOCGL|nr:ferredoxin [Rhodococcus globerulus]
MTMLIVANQSSCIGSGQCVFTDPDTFDQDDDGVVVVLRSEPAADDEVALAKQAVDVCPSRALSLVARKTPV